jgi:hypothetical protein
MDGAYSRVDETPERGFLTNSIGVPMQDTQDPLRAGKRAPMGI